MIDMVQQLSINSTDAEVFLPKVGHFYKHKYNWIFPLILEEIQKIVSI